jgi:hypothetical protein
MGEELWSERAAFLRSLDRVPAALANADLLEQAQERWAGKVIPRTSMHDLLFTMPDDPYPWQQDLRVSAIEGAFEFRFSRDGLLVTADRATAPNAPAVLDALLLQLVDA